MGFILYASWRALRKAGGGGGEASARKTKKLTSLNSTNLEVQMSWESSYILNK